MKHLAVRSDYVRVPADQFYKLIGPRDVISDKIKIVRSGSAVKIYHTFKYRYGEDFGVTIQSNDAYECFIVKENRLPLHTKED